MKKITILLCSLFLLLTLSCELPKTDRQEDKKDTEVLVETLGNPTAQSTQHKVKELCKLCADKDIVIVILYVFSLLLSCLYYKQTGKHSEELEANLAHLSTKLPWRQRAALYIMRLIQKVRGVKKQ